MKKPSTQAAPEATYEGSDLEALSALRRYREWMMKHFRPYLGGDVIEIGAGVGNMSEHLDPHVSTLDLLEPSSNLIGPLKSKFSDSDTVVVMHETFESFIAAKPEKKYDCIVMVNVLEHIEDDRAALLECYRALRPGGYLLILVPALQFLFSKLDHLVGHFRRYERAELEQKIQESGLQIEELRFFDSIGIVPWWLLNTIGGATEFNPALISLYDAVFVPVTRLLETLIEPPIGKNLIAISRRLPEGPL